MKRVSVYCRNNGWYISSMSQTTAGVWIGTPPHLKILSDDSADLGSAVVTALEASRQSVAHPIKWDKTLFDPMLSLAGVASWKEFVTSAARVAVAVDQEMIAIEPFENSGPNDGYTPLPHKNLQLPMDSTPEAIGEAVKQAIRLCE